MGELASPSEGGADDAAIAWPVAPSLHGRFIHAREALDGLIVDEHLEVAGQLTVATLKAIRHRFEDLHVTAPPPRPFCDSGGGVVRGRNRPTPIHPASRRCAASRYNRSGVLEVHEKLKLLDPQKAERFDKEDVAQV